MTDSPVVPALIPPGMPRTSEPSRWRMRIANARPAWSLEIEQLASRRIDRNAIDAQLALERSGGWRDEAHLCSGLRHLRAKALAALIDRDLDGRADLAEVMDATTALAEIAIGEALVFLSHRLAARHGVPCGRASGDPQDLVVIGMGKLGGGELNVSSDIDLIFVYREDGETTGTTGDDGFRTDRRPDREREPKSPSLRVISNEEFFTRLGRKLIAALAEVTADGFVFRVDMRLRPDGDSGPLVTHFAMLEHYLIGSARDWERFAWIKARVVSPRVFASGDVEPHARADETFAQLVTPFVYRRYLDFGAIDALRKLHDQIRAEAARREAMRNERSSRYAAHHEARSGSGVASRLASGAVLPTASTPASTRIDVKLGRGGIREIEFIAQHFQLIRGGREPALRLRPTLATLAVLVREELIDERVGKRLCGAYVFLRNVEHRLQYLDDAQTHTLPAREAVEDCERVAAMCAPLVDTPDGVDEGDASTPVSFDTLLVALESHRNFVARQFDGVFGLEDEETNVEAAGASGADLWSAFSDASPVYARDEAAAQQVRAHLAASGFDPPDGAFARLAALARSARLRTIAKATRARLDSLVPRVIESASESASAQSDPTATLGRWFDLIEAIAGRSAYLALLEEFSVARKAVTRLLSASPWAAQYLTRHPLLLDDLIDARDDDRRPRDAAAWSASWREVAKTLAAQLHEAAPDTERQMDVLRETHHAETFRLLIDDLEGRLTIEALSDQLSALADLILDAAIRACWASLAPKGADRKGADDVASRPEPAFAVIGFGKLGGKELGYASDLDLVFLYDDRNQVDNHEADQSLAVQRYARFAQRLNVWLTARTTAGALFDIDLRLRPDGAAGLVVSSFASWSAYERRENDVGAWTWEHQALTRARFSAGDSALGAAFEAERIAILVDRVPDERGRAQLRGDIVAMRKKMHDGHPNRSGRFDLKHDEGGMVDIEFAVQYLVLAFGDAHRELLVNAGNIALLSRAADAGLIEAGEARGAADAYRVYRARQHASRLADPEARAARVDADAFLGERAVVRRLWASLFSG